MAKGKNRLRLTERVVHGARIVGSCMVVALGLSACGAPQVHLPKPSANCDSTKIKDCRERCDNNEGRACYRLGWFYEDGENGPKDMNYAIKPYHRAFGAKRAARKTCH